MLGVVLLTVGLPVAFLLVLAGVTIIGRERFGQFRREYRDRVRASAPAVVFLGALLVLNHLLRAVGGELSWLIGWNVTGAIYAFEGGVVAGLQSVVPSILTPVFAATYLVGYVFLLVFPLIAYLVLRDGKYLRETAYAYSINYGVGLACYLAFIAYGPRNLMPDLVEPLLYTAWPESQLLTSQVNTNTNVFPSLHSSLSLTAALLAYRTRDIYPTWVPVAAALALAVMFSTMYLGIHWATDVLAGAVLAVLAVRASVYIEAHRSVENSGGSHRDTSHL